MAIATALIGGVALVLSQVIPAAINSSGETGPADPVTKARAENAIVDSEVRIEDAVVGGEVSVGGDLNIGGSSPQAVDPPDGDAALEVAEVEFGANTVDVPLNVDAISPSDLAELESAGALGPTTARPINILLSNQSDNPALITDVELVIHDALYPNLCLEIGEPVLVTYVYNFSVPRLDGTWTATMPQSYEVAGNDIDAFAVTIGPEDPLPFTPTLYSFSLTALTADGSRLRLADGITADDDDLDVAVYIAFIDDVITGRDRPEDWLWFQSCARDAIAEIDAFGNQHTERFGDDLITPALDMMRRIFEEAIVLAAERASSG